MASFTAPDLVDFSVLKDGLPATLPPASAGQADTSVPHAPNRNPQLSAGGEKLALANALRYFPAAQHGELAPEFAAELREFGHIYMYRFRPKYEIKAYPFSSYRAATKCDDAACVLLMIMNNLDRRVAQFPQELITYGGNGSVLSNWAQYALLCKYLCEMADDQTLAMYSGHPMGLYPSSKAGPRMVITNGMVIPNYSSKADYDRLYAQGNTIYGQMTAGSYCYIGPQGIVHGTAITVLNAGRKYLGLDDLTGKVYVSSGLGGMSGAQPKAAVICGAIGVIAEVDANALRKRHAQGWVDEVCDAGAAACVARIEAARSERKAVSIGFLGNVVDLWEALAAHPTLVVELGSDQTSLHNPYGGGYVPAGLDVEASTALMNADPAAFKAKVRTSLRRQVAAINALAARGMRFWDYGNSFLLEASRAGADILEVGAVAAAGDGAPTTFRYPTYVQDIMGDIFSLGFGPFRWVCSSGSAADLATTDALAAKIMRRLAGEARAEGAPQVAAQFDDNVKWIDGAAENDLVVGSQARILYADADGRSQIAEAMNAAVAAGELSAPVVISRDHHDVSGTDSPFRETSNITDGSAFTADMAVQNVIGDALRGATWVSLHNGGGCGWGEVMNGGFGHVLDGTEEAGAKAKNMLFWDVNNGVSRRAWGRNANAQFASSRAQKKEPKLRLTTAHHADDALLEAALSA